MKNLVMLLVLFVCMSAFSIPQETVSPDRWRGMVMSETTPKDAIAKFGTPTKDSVEKLEIPRIAKWLTKKRDQKVWRRLEYKKGIADFDLVWLTFLDNKLVVIQLEPATAPFRNSSRVSSARTLSMA